MSAGAADAVSAALERARASASPVVLMVDHGGGGGIGRHVEELTRGLRGRATVLLLRPDGEHGIAVELGLGGAKLRFPKRDGWPDLLSLLRGVGIDRVHFHHVHRLPPSVLDLPRLCGAACWVTLHDYYPACPAYHLKDGSLRFCGGTAECRRCLDAGAPTWDISIDEWRARFGALLAGAERVVAPSRDAADRIRAFYPDIAPVVWPHAAGGDVAWPRRARIVVPGAISVEKGLDVLDACAADAQRRELPLHFRVAGFLARALPLWPHRPLTVAGEYPEGRLAELLALEAADVFFFPAQCPETFSYTLSAALASGKPIVASDLGALPERLAGCKRASVLPWRSAPAEFNDALVEAARDCLGPARAEPAGPAMDEYVARYVQGMSRRPASATLPVLDPRWLLAAPEMPREEPLDWLFEDGVLAGKLRSREVLRQRAQETDRELIELRAQLHDARSTCAAQAASLVELREALAAQTLARERASAAAAAATAMLGSLESSRAWRLLRPVRAIARWLGLTRTPQR